MLEITASYIGELGELMDRLQTLDKKPTPHQTISKYYINTSVKNIEKLLYDIEILFEQK